MTSSWAREFERIHFLPNLQEWRSDPLDLRKAMNAVLAANQLADWVFQDCKINNPGLVANFRKPTDKDDRRAPGEFRDWLATNRCTEFALIRDIADCHKHMEINRRSALVRRASAATEVSGVFDVTVFDDLAFDTDHISIALDSGGEHRLPDLLHNVASMWSQLLDEWSL